MLAFDRRVTLEDHLGVRHPACLLEAIDGHYFVLVPPDDAEVLARMQGDGAPAEEALDVLERAVGVMDVRRHEFLAPGLAAEALSGSVHHILRLLSARLEEALLPAAPPAEEELSVHAFLEECRRRSTW